jgi:ABC-type sugar transport system ATPase subunit
MGSIQLKDVRKAFGAVSIINGVNLNIENGKFAVFVGRPAAASRRFCASRRSRGRHLRTGADRRQGHDECPPARLAMVFQSYALYPHMSVRGNIAFALKMPDRKPTSSSRRCARPRRPSTSPITSIASRASFPAASASAPISAHRRASRSVPVRRAAVQSTRARADAAIGELHGR